MVRLRNILKKCCRLADGIFPSIKLSTNCSTSHIYFLDTTVHIKNKIETESFFIPFDVHLNLLPTSCHLRYTTNNIPFFWHYKCGDFAPQKHVYIQRKRMLGRRYKDSFITKAIDKAKITTRESLFCNKSSNKSRASFINHHFFTPSYQILGKFLTNIRTL